MVIEDAYGDYDGIGEWIVNVNRSLSDCKVGEYKALLQLLSTKRVNTDRDQVIWKLKQNGELTNQVLLQLSCDR